MSAQNRDFLQRFAVAGHARPARTRFIHLPFGSEYASLPRWGVIRRWYIRIFGIVDLPSRLRARLVLREMCNMQPRSVLDIGCGTGAYSFFLSRNPDLEVVGLDIDPRRISDCSTLAQRLQRSNVRFTAGSAESGLRRFAPGSMDVILAVEVLQYCRNIGPVLFEIGRLLSPGGNCLMHVPMLGYLRPSETQIFDDDGLKRLATQAGLVCNRIRPTFGGGLRFACRIFGWASQYQMLTALLFPLLLVFSLPFARSFDSGDYRLFILHKPELPPVRKEP